MTSSDRHQPDSVDRAPPDPRTDRCLIVEVAAAAVDEVAGLLWTAGATGVAEVELPGGRVRLVAGVPPDAVASTLQAATPWGPMEVVDGHHDRWVESWRPFARSVRVGRVVVHPSWAPPGSNPDVDGDLRDESGFDPDRDTGDDPDRDTGDDPAHDAGDPDHDTDDDPAHDAGDVLVPIDPGAAFGHGDHPTTRMVLEVLVASVPPARRVLDVGCGSGVLAVVAARLGATEVRAVDIDPAAVAVTAANAARNGVSERVEVDDAALATVPGRFDLVVANIDASVLVAIGPDLVERVAPGGHLVVSGLLASRLDDVVEACPPLRVVGEQRQPAAGSGVWVACTLRADGVA